MYAIVENLENRENVNEKKILTPSSETVIVNVLAVVHSRPFPITSHRLGHDEDLALDIFILCGILSYHYVNKCQCAITCFHNLFIHFLLSPCWTLRWFVIFFNCEFSCIKLFVMEKERENTLFRGLSS